MNLKIRQEKEMDYTISENLVEKAFKNAEYSDYKEHLLVAKLRKSDAFIPELSRVAEINGEIVGHIMLTELIIESDVNRHDSLALAPVSVLPEHQNKGVGSKLIRESLKVAKEMGYKSVIVLGHHEYYPRFGFKPASIWGIKAPFEVPNEAFMAVELESRALEGIRGTVVYSKEFLE